MRYVLGVDGGGSKTACLVADETGRLLGYGGSGPVNTNYVVRREAVSSLEQAVDEALREAQLSGGRVEALCLSAPMAPDAVEEAAEHCGIRRIVRAAEGETPRWAARFWIEGHVGVTVDAGTGSMARGWSRDGREAGAGGWGATLGDEGSGYWIGLRAMIAILQAHDGRIAATGLTGRVLAHLGLSDVVDMVFRVSQGLAPGAGAGRPIRVAPDSGGVTGRPEPSTGGMVFRAHSSERGPLTRAEVAGLCPVVARLAREGDWKAVEILGKAGVELGRLALAVVGRLGMQEDRFAVVPFGGVFRAGELVLRPCRETIRPVAPQAEVVGPRFEPVVGAVLLALDALGVAIDGRITAAIERSASLFPTCGVE